DGTGHGPSACVVMLTMRAILHTHPELHRDPGCALTGAGRLLHTLLPPDLFMSGLYLAFHDHGRVSWASAGHEPPLRVNPLGQIAPVELKPVGLPLGIVADEAYTTVHWRLDVGERLFLFTDGLVDARSRDQQRFGRRRLRVSLSQLGNEPLGETV